MPGHLLTSSRLFQVKCGMKLLHCGWECQLCQYRSLLFLDYCFSMAKPSTKLRRSLKIWNQIKSFLSLPSAFFHTQPNNVFYRGRALQCVKGLYTDDRFASFVQLQTKLNLTHAFYFFILFWFKSYFFSPNQRALHKLLSFHLDLRLCFCLNIVL